MTEQKDVKDLIVNLDGELLTIKDYLKKLLEELWTYGESFSGKRPFGDSGWVRDLYNPLIGAGVIEGGIDEWGEIEGDFDEQQAWEVIMRVIKEL